MKKLPIIAIFVAALCYTSNAQPPNRANRIEALKVAYITRMLNLTSEEAQKFWPVYNIYFEELKQARRSNKEDELKFEEDALNVRKKYKSEFKKILNDDIRVNKVFRVDIEFRNELQKELKKRQQMRQQQKKVPLTE